MWEQASQLSQWLPPTFLFGAGTGIFFVAVLFQANVAKIYNLAAFTASLRTSAMPTTAFYKSPAMTDLSRI
ncbi:hypothetical protein, partial [Pseudomonas sp.]|uniref:hypothetical protein n=1 Tax=Pseudomonas sp. TaxID=306 RepID=UPI003267F791